MIKSQVNTYVCHGYGSKLSINLKFEV